MQKIVFSEIFVQLFKDCLFQDFRRNRQNTGWSKIPNLKFTFSLKRDLTLADFMSVGKTFFLSDWQVNKLSKWALYSLRSIFNKKTNKQTKKTEQEPRQD